MLGLGGMEPIIAILIIAGIFFFGRGTAKKWIRDIKDVASEADESTEKDKNTK